MSFYGDYHTHSKYSDGSQDIEEILDAAIRRGLNEVAITDHGPLAAVIGVKDEEIYLQIKRIIEKLTQEGIYDLQVLVGAEANIRSIRGKLDIPDHVIEELDILIAGLHPYTLPVSWQDGIEVFLQNSLRHLSKLQKEKAVNANTKASVEAIYNNPRLDIISHPGLFFEVNIKEVAVACAKNDVLFEINCGHKHPALSDIMEANLIGVDFIVNSDAHFSDTVGELEYGRAIIEELNIEPDRIVNLQDNGGYKQWGKKMKNYTYL